MPADCRCPDNLTYILLFTRITNCLTEDRNQVVVQRHLIERRLGFEERLINIYTEDCHKNSSSTIQPSQISHDHESTTASHYDLAKIRTICSKLPILVPSNPQFVLFDHHGDISSELCGPTHSPTNQSIPS